MSDIVRASRRRALASLGGLAAFAFAPPAFGGTQSPPSSGKSDSGARFEPVDLSAAPAAGLADVLEALHGKAVLVNFWASWCGPCRDELPALVNLADSEPGLALITVAVADRAADTARFLAAQQLAPTVVADPAQHVAIAWHVRMLPTTVVLDGAHRPRAAVRGELDWNDDDVRAHLRTLLAASPAAATRTGGLS